MMNDENEFRWMWKYGELSTVTQSEMHVRFLKGYPLPCPSSKIIHSFYLVFFSIKTEREKQNLFNFFQLHDFYYIFLRVCAIVIYRVHMHLCMYICMQYA